MHLKLKGKLLGNFCQVFQEISNTVLRRWFADMLHFSCWCWEAEL